VRIEPSSGAVIGLLVLFASLWLLQRLLPVILVLVAALILVGTLSPAVLWLEEHRLRRSLGIALVFAILLAATLTFVTLTIPNLIEQARTLLLLEPALRARLGTWLAESPLTQPLAGILAGMRSTDLVQVAFAQAITFSSRVIAILAYITSAIFLALYIMIDRDRLRGGLFLLVPRTHHIRLSRVMLNLETIVGGYLRGQVFTSVLMAAFVFILLRACGIPGALAIAIFAGAADVLPYTGPLLSVGAASVAALSRGPAIVIMVLVLMFAYEEFESRVIVPRIYGRSLRLPSSVILFSLFAASMLMGIAGALLALPVAAAVLMLVEELRVDMPGQQEQAEDVQTRMRDDEGEEEYERRADGMPANLAAAIAVEISKERQKEEQG
jgi:predicted PurR-regulated permease PerM